MNGITSRSSFARHDEHGVERLPYHSGIVEAGSVQPFNVLLERSDGVLPVHRRPLDHGLKTQTGRLESLFPGTVGFGDMV